MSEEAEKKEEALDQDEAASAEESAAIDEESAEETAESTVTETPPDEEDIDIGDVISDAVEEIEKENESEAEAVEASADATPEETDSAPEESSEPEATPEAAEEPPSNDASDSEPAETPEPTEAVEVVETDKTTDEPAAEETPVAEEKEEADPAGDDLDELEAEIQAQLAKAPALEEEDNADAESESDAEAEKTEDKDAPKEDKAAQKETAEHSSGGLNPRIPIAIGALGVILGGMSLKMNVKIKKDMQNAAPPPSHLFENLNTLKDSDREFTARIEALEKRFDAIDQHITANTAPIKDSLKLLHHDLNEVKQGLAWNSETIGVVNLTIGKLFNEDIEANREDFIKELDNVYEFKLVEGSLPIDDVVSSMKQLEEEPLNKTAETTVSPDSQIPKNLPEVQTVAANNQPSIEPTNEQTKQTTPQPTAFETAAPLPKPIAISEVAPAPPVSTNPTPAVASVEERPRPPRPATHTVVAGDNFRQIALQYDVPVTAIMGENPDVDPRDLRVGQEIKLPN